MGKYKVFFLVTCLLVTFFFGAPLIVSVLAQSPAPTASTSIACAVTKVGNPAVMPTLPPECFVGGAGLPPNMGACLPVGAQNSGGVPGEYCQMPAPLDGSYEKRIQSNKWQDWGSKEIISALYTIAQSWKRKYPQGHLIIMDITSDYHIEHKFGAAVDITATTNNKDCVADFIPGRTFRCRYGPYNRNATIDLGKIIVDSGYLDAIWYNDTTVNAAVFAYAKSKFPSRYTSNTSGRTGLRPVVDHDDHFHLVIDRTTQKTSSHTTNFSRSQLKDCTYLTGALRKVCFP